MAGSHKFLVSLLIREFPRITKAELSAILGIHFDQLPQNVNYGRGLTWSEWNIASRHYGGIDLKQNQYVNQLVDVVTNISQSLTHGGVLEASTRRVVTNLIKGGSIRRNKYCYKGKIYLVDHVGAILFKLFCVKASKLRRKVDRVDFSSIIYLRQGINFNPDKFPRSFKVIL